jgi:hypothetical protein
MNQQFYGNQRRSTTRTRSRSRSRGPAALTDNFGARCARSMSTPRGAAQRWRSQSADA